MDDHHPPGTRDVPQLAARVFGGVPDGLGQEENRTCDEELGPTQIVLPPPSGSLSVADRSFGGLHLETRREWDPLGFVEDVRAERGENVLSDTGVGETSSPVNPDRSRDFREQDPALNSSGFVGSEDDARTAADFPSIALHDNADCEERHLGMSSDFEQGLFRDRGEVTVACLDLNVEEELEEGTDLDHLHSAELDAREMTEGALSSMPGCLVQEGGNGQGSQCAQTEAIEQLELNNKGKEYMVGFDLVRQPNATKHSIQGKEMVSSTGLFLERDWKIGSSEVGCLENRFLAFPCSENVHVGDLNDEIGASSSQVYGSALTVAEDDLQNGTYPPHTSFEPPPVRREHLTDSRGVHAASCNTVFVDAEEELVGTESRKADPVDVQGESVVQLPDISSMTGGERMSKEEREKHRIQETGVSEDGRPLMSKIEKPQDNQLIPLHVMEVDTAKLASEEEEEISFSRPGEKFPEGSFHLDRQPGCMTFAPEVSVSLCPPVGDVEGKTYSGSLHEDMLGNTKHFASQLSEQHINHEITTERNIEQLVSEPSEEVINREITREQEFVEPSEEVINREITREQEFVEEHDEVLLADEDESAAEEVINREITREQEFVEEHDVVLLADEDESATEFIDQKIDDQASTESSEGGTDKEITKEQTAARGHGANFHVVEDESNIELIDSQSCGKVLMQLEEDHSNENVMNEEKVVEEQGGNFHMDEDVYALEPVDKQVDDQDSTQHSDKDTNDEIRREQNAAVEYGGRFHVEGDYSAVEPADKQIDGHCSMQASEEYVAEEVTNDQRAAEENDGVSHMDEDEFGLEVVHKQIDDHGSSQPSEEHIDDEMTEEDSTVGGQVMELSGMELANRQVDDETSVQLSEDHNDAVATRGQHDVEDHGGNFHMEQDKCALTLISDRQIVDQNLTEEKVVDEFDGTLLEAEHNASGVWIDGGSEETIKGEEIFGAGGGERFSEEMGIEEHSAELPSRISQEGFKFGVGDLVWAKVKSHPWWPGQIFDPADASAFAKKVRKPDRIFVAFFGDCTFGWLQEPQIIAFRPNFEEKIKQTNMKSFCKAVAEALDEVCRRAELGTSCACHGGFLHSAGTFPDANTGIQKGVRIKHHPDISMSKAGFKPETILEFVKGVASSPFGLWSSSLEGAETRGHVYGSRTGIHSMKKSDPDDLLQNVLTGLRGRAGRVLATPRQGLKLKRRFSSLETDSGMVAGWHKEGKKINTGKDGMLKKPPFDGGLQSVALGNSPKVNETDGIVALEEKTVESGKVQGLKESAEDTILGKGKRASFRKKFESSKKPRRSRLDGEAPESMVGTGASKEKSSDDDTETLFALAGFHSKLLKKLGKGNTREGSVKSSTDVKSVFNIVVNREGLGQTQEVKPSKRILGVDRTFKESSEAQAEVTSNLSALPAPHLERTSECRTKVPNDVDPSLPKDAELPNNDFIIAKAESKKIMLDDNLFVKDKKTVDEASVTVLNSKHQQEVTVKGGKQCNILRPKQETDVKKPSKAMKLGECIQRIAGELTGTPPITKSVNQSSTKRAIFDVSMKSGPKKEMTGSIPDSFGLSKNHRSPASLSVDEKTRRNSLKLLQGLHFLARNPLNNANTSKPLGEVTTAFLKFRNMVFQKSAGYDAAVSRSGEQSMGKTDGHFNSNDHASNPKSIALKSQPGTQDFSPSIKKHGVQELALAARKRKSEVVQEGLAKISKKGMVTSTPKGQHAFKTGTSAAKFIEQSHRSKPQKHYPSRNISPTSNVKSPIRQSDDKLSSHSPVGLYMKFPQNFALPSDAQLKATFVRFGALQTAGTRVYRSNAAAQVVFKHGHDAEIALKYAKENAIFGQAAVTFRLRHFSQPERIDSKQNISAFDKEKSVRVDGRLSSLTMERLESMHHVTRPSSLDRGERGRTGSVADVPASWRRQATENANNNNISLNLSSLIPNSASTVNESSGDIQDQMIKLLRQVSVIVSSSSLTTEAS